MKSLTTLILIILLSSCSSITDPGAVVDAPTPNSIAVIGFTGSAWTNYSPTHNLVWYDIVVIEDKGSNITNSPERINLEVTDQQLNRMSSLRPFRTVLIAEKSGKYWKLISITKN